MLSRYPAEWFSVPAAEVDFPQFGGVGQPNPVVGDGVGGLACAGKIGRNHDRLLRKETRQAPQLRHVRQIGRDICPSGQHFGVGRSVPNPPPCRFYIQAGRCPLRAKGRPATTATTSPDAAAIFRFISPCSSLKRLARAFAETPPSPVSFETAMTGQAAELNELMSAPDSDSRSASASNFSVSHIVTQSNTPTSSGRNAASAPSASPCASTVRHPVGLLRR